jgi:hypothetical protein
LSESDDASPGRLSDRDLDRLRAVVGDDTFAGRYAIVREAGAGGMGRVFEATAAAGDRRVAIKVIADRGLADHARFNAEVAILERLDHPAIVDYVGHGVTSAGEPYLAMDWLDGESLAARLARGPLAIADAVAIGARVAHALVHAHDEGIVHRDIKPSNVLLVDGDPARATLIDFGVAKDTEVARDLTHTGQLVGTPGYMAPEQVVGKATIDGRADLFALGCMLHECVTGESPFGAAEVMRILARLLLEDPPRLAAARDDVPPRLDALVAALLAKDPEHRLADAATAARELDAIAAALASGDTAALAETPIAVREDVALAPTVHDAPRPPLPISRRPGIVAFVVGAALVVALVGVAVFVFVVGDDGAPPPATGVCTIRDRSGCVALCERGSGEACRMAGDAAITGKHDFAVDIPRGRAWLLRSCELGYGPGCASYAAHVRFAIKDDPSLTPADWERAAIRGCDDLKYKVACLQLADGYTGDGLPVDDAKSTTYFGRACDAGQDASCSMYAKRVRDGVGVAADPVRATAILQKACDGGSQSACERLEEWTGSGSGSN